AGATAAAALHADVPARAEGPVTPTMMVPLGKGGSDSTFVFGQSRPNDPASRDDQRKSSLTHSALQRLIPPLLERGVVLGEVRVIQIDEALALVGVEADTLFGFGRDLGIGDRAVVAHVLGASFLRRWLEHFVQADTRGRLVP